MFPCYSALLRRYKCTFLEQKEEVAESYCRVECFYKMFCARSALCAPFSPSWLFLLCFRGAPPPPVSHNRITNKQTNKRQIDGHKLRFSAVSLLVNVFCVANERKNVCTGKCWLHKRRSWSFSPWALGNTVLAEACHVKWLLTRKREGSICAIVIWRGYTGTFKYVIFSWNHLTEKEALLKMMRLVARKRDCETSRPTADCEAMIRWSSSSSWLVWHFQTFVGANYHFSKWQLIESSIMLVVIVCRSLFALKVKGLSVEILPAQ